MATPILDVGISTGERIFENIELFIWSSYDAGVVLTKSLIGWVIEIIGKLAGGSKITGKKVVSGVIVFINTILYGISFLPRPDLSFLLVILGYLLFKIGR